MKIHSVNHIACQIESRIMTLAINNPPHNFLKKVFFEELASFVKIMGSDEIDAVVFTGNGNCFSKGADLKEITAGSHFDQKTILMGNALFSYISGLKKPVIAAINGACLGGGLELALSCHLRVCSEKSRIGLPEVSVGLIPGLGGIERLIAVVGKTKALEMILLGDMLSASRALELNIVSRVYSKQDFHGHVRRFVKTLLSAKQEAIAQVYELFSLYRNPQEETAIRETAKSFFHLLSMQEIEGQN
jgi:enoyl-CoA hydratase